MTCSPLVIHHAAWDLMHQLDRTIGWENGDPTQRPQLVHPAFLLIRSELEACSFHAEMHGRKDERGMIDGPLLNEFRAEAVRQARAVVSEALAQACQEQPGVSELFTKSRVREMLTEIRERAYVIGGEEVLAQRLASFEKEVAAL